MKCDEKCGSVKEKKKAIHFFWSSSSLWFIAKYHNLLHSFALGTFSGSCFLLTLTNVTFLTIMMYRKEVNAPSSYTLSTLQGTEDYSLHDKSWYISTGKASRVWHWLLKDRCWFILEVCLTLKITLICQTNFYHCHT